AMRALPLVAVRMIVPVPAVPTCVGIMDIVLLIVTVCHRSALCRTVPCAAVLHTAGHGCRARHCIRPGVAPAGWLPPSRPAWYDGAGRAGMATARSHPRAASAM